MIAEGNCGLARITSYNVCYTKLLRNVLPHGRRDIGAAFRLEIPGALLLAPDAQAGPLPQADLHLVAGPGDRVATVAEEDEILLDEPVSYNFV